MTLPLSHTRQGPGGVFFRKKCGQTIHVPLKEEVKGLRTVKKPPADTCAQ